MKSTQANARQTGKARNHYTRKDENKKKREKQMLLTSTHALTSSHSHTYTPTSLNAMTEQLRNELDFQQLPYQHCINIHCNKKDFLP